MSWNRESIAAEQRKIVGETLSEASREELLEEIVRLRSGLYPLVATLSSLDDKAPRGVMAKSKLFPADLGEGREGGRFAVYDPATQEFVNRDVPSREFHLHEYEEAESETVMNGKEGEARMHDDVSILSVHGYWIGAYAFCGEITMGDVRHAAGLLRRPAAAPAPVAPAQGLSDASASGILGA